MFVKITTSGPRQYVKLGETDALVNGLLRVTGRPTLDEGTGEIDFASARSFGDTWMLTALWNELGFFGRFSPVVAPPAPV